MNSKSSNGLSHSGLLPGFFACTWNNMWEKDQLVTPTAKRCAGAHSEMNQESPSIVHSGKKPQSKGMDHRIKTQGWHQQKSKSWQNNGINGSTKRTNALHIFHRKDNNGVFPKWNMNSLNSANSGSMNWSQFKYSVSHMCLAGALVASWSLTQEVAGVCSFCWNFTERQILWSLCSVDFHTLTLQLPIQTLHSVAPELPSFCEFTQIFSKTSTPLSGRFEPFYCNDKYFW